MTSETKLYIQDLGEWCDFLPVENGEILPASSKYVVVNPGEIVLQIYFGEVKLQTYEQVFIFNGHIMLNPRGEFFWASNLAVRDIFKLVE